MGSIPELGRSPGVGNGNPLQYSCLENFINRGAWWVTVHGFADSWTWLSKWACMHIINYSHHGVHCISRTSFITVSLYLLTTFTHFPHPTLVFQFSSVTHLGPTLQDPKDCSMPGFHVHHQLLELAQIHVHQWWTSHQWCHPTISFSLIPFSSCLQSFPASGSFPMSQFFSSGVQSTGASASASVLPVNIQDWSPLGWTGLISLQSKGLSRVFSNTTVFKNINSLVLSFLYGPTLTSIHNYFKKP